MAQTMKTFTSRQDFLDPSDYIDAKAVSASAASFTVPAGAKYCRLSGTADFYYKYNNGTAAAPTGVADGSASALCPYSGEGSRNLIVKPGDTISVFGTAEITAEYWNV